MLQAAREEYWTPAYFPETVKEGQGGETLALAWLEEYLEKGTFILWGGEGSVVCAHCVQCSTFARDPRPTDLHARMHAWTHAHTRTQTGPEAFGQRHLPSSGEGLERQVMRRLIASKGPIPFL